MVVGVGNVERPIRSNGNAFSGIQLRLSSVRQKHKSEQHEDRALQPSVHSTSLWSKPYFNAGTEQGQTKIRGGTTPGPGFPHNLQEY